MVSPAPSADHRPWPVPDRPWSWRQTCHDVLFLHWPLPPATLRPLVPTALALDEREGSAWISVVALRLSGVTARGWPALPWLSRFAQLNVRTYVRHSERPGVWFFSLDAGNWLAARVARRLFHLPYYHAAIRVRRTDGRVAYHSARSTGPRFEVEYAPTGPAAPPTPDTLEHWLTERYCLYQAAPAGRLYRAEIHHTPWPLQRADATVRRNELVHELGVTLARPAALRSCSPGVDIIAWTPEAVR